MGRIFYRFKEIQVAEQPYGVAPFPDNQPKPILFLKNVNGYCECDIEYSKFNGFIRKKVLLFLK